MLLTFLLMAKLNGISFNPGVNGLEILPPRFRHAAGVAKSRGFFILQFNPCPKGQGY